MVGVLHPTRRKNEGKNLVGRKDLELSERLHEAICSEKATGDARGEEDRPHESMRLDSHTRLVTCLRPSIFSLLPFCFF